MKNKTLQRVLCFVLSVTLLLGAFGFSGSAATLKVDPNEKNPYSASTLEEMQSLVGTLSYDNYLANYAEFDPSKLSPIVVDILSTNDGQTVAENAFCQSAKNEYPDSWVNFGAENEENSIYLPATGSVTWQVTLSKEQAGLYYIKIEYFDVKTSESSISTIERKLLIDGKVPFSEVSTVNFNKNWTYDNISVSEPVAVPGEPDSYDVDYKQVEDGYLKVVTEVKDGVKTVTTYTLSQDINGNSMSPGFVELPGWNTYHIADSTGYYSGYFSFFMAEGTRTITLEAEREPMVIKSIELIPATDTNSTPGYEDVLEQYQQSGYKPAVNGSIVEIQAEFPDLVSDSSVAPTNDNTSAINTPISPNAQLYNVIGENSYSAVGQWAAYKFQVSESGLYNFAMRYKQSALQGMYVCRTIKLSGGQYGETPTAPFLEAYDAEFQYNDAWQSTFVGLKDQAPFMFYFEEGVEYTLYLECSLGTLKNYIKRVEDSLETINSCYLRILQLTGTEPDEYRGYGFADAMPDVLVDLLEQALELMDVKNGLQELCGTNGSHIATLQTIAVLLHTMGKDKGENIAANMSTLKSYLGTLGTWINSSKASSITVDSIWVVPTGSEDGKAVAVTESLPKAEAGFFASIWFEIRAFFASFFTEYDQMGLTTVPDEDTPSIDVWLATGRDQSQIWRTMIDAHGSFTDSTGTAVALKLVTGGTLLPSILSGKGPDVYMGLGASDVINYAIRDAVVGISGNAKVTDNWSEEDNTCFKTTYYTYKNADGTIETTTEYKGEENLTFTSRPFAEVVGENFSDAAMDTVTLLDVSYGIPDTMSFAMMFYRMDVLAELGQEVPESWDDLLSILPVLQSNNMNIGVAYINALDFMIYQKGGSMWKYTDESLYSSEYAGARIDLDSNIALEAFQFTCRLYTDYSFPVSYDAANRFRTGEMPIIIGDYVSIYNQLVVYATEIEGLWEFCSLPGSFREDGSFNYDSLAGISSLVILYGCDNLLASWQFMQWQTSAEAQAQYGNRMVALIGPSAKYGTANLNAINNLSWTAKEKAAIMNQMEHLSSIVNYPGSYIYNRYMQFAFLDVVNEGANAHDAMMGYIDAINAEIARKRQEFGLWVPTSADDEPPQLATSYKTNE
ncbi:MAG: extracellular solute-binding protein [Clostridia bacterium]|nr:extracellular solute-binding protein [Clostridia bacterium]